jgi:hypothetical protein
MAVAEKQFAGGDKRFFSVMRAGGLNTEAPRVSIKDEQFSWLENLQPIADGNFRALYDVAPAIYSTAHPLHLLFHYEYNIGSSNYAAVFLTDGTAYQVNTDTSAVTTISATGGSFFGGSTTALPACAQFGQQGLIIVSSAALGYSFWNGTTLFAPSGLGPTVTITNGGAAYTSAPVVVFNGGGGSGAVGVAAIANGSVTGVTVTNPGTGYGSAPTISFVGGQQTGSGASLTAVLSAFPSGSGAALTANWNTAIYGPGSQYDQLASITGPPTGTGYSASTTAAWHDAGLGGFWLNGAPPSINLTIAGGVITAVSFTASPANPSVIYFNNNHADPTITVTDPVGGKFFVSSVTGTPTGTNYSPSTTIIASGGGSPVTQTTLTPVISAGVITSVNIISGGVYGTNTPPTLTIADVAVTATATCELMPIGIAGTCVEIYAGRIWIGNGAVINFNAPGGDVANWAPSQGGGSFTSNDSFLRRAFTALKQAEGFLYLFADSSINVISNVQTGGSPVLTTFNNQNVDPEVGTPWPNAVQAMSEGLVFANVIGVFTLSGGNVKKVSDEVDGTFRAATATLNADTPANFPTSAVMTLNNRLVYMLVLPVAGPFDGGVLRNAVLMWDTRRFWIGSQSVSIFHIGTQEINSQIYAWVGTDLSLQKMFTVASGTLNKVWQTKLFSTEALESNQLMRLFTMALDNSTGGYTFTGTFDYQLEQTAVATAAFTVALPNLTGSGSLNASPRGNYMGMTLKTTKDDFTLVTQKMLYQVQSPLGG